MDPKFALAYCGLADTYGWAGGQTLPGREAWAKEMEFAQKALELDPNLAEAHLSMGTLSSPCWIRAVPLRNSTAPWN